MLRQAQNDVLILLCSQQNLAGELRFERHFGHGAQHFRDWAVFLSIFGVLLEVVGRDVAAGYVAFGADVNVLDDGMAVVGVHRHGAGGGDVLDRVAVLGEHAGEVHGVAAGMGRADELFGVGAGLAFEAAAYRVGRVEEAAVSAEGTTAFDVAVPDGFACMVCLDVVNW